ncbi:GTP:AMP phosphotransferase AK3, mitochondrial [Phlebotomus argentipes]|uniref:GTP:AMP phosphotransferase AK3, mitochondrial n=1 Tax=Phlebotomus argentipes TaxID=94469 RepID=UPI002893063C|nr:GTP:AMP phosphotransferase AK3, mitochondrial [Phlebotomus argentipes]
MSKVFRMLIMGAPASGKGTISGRIVKRFNFQHISSGDLLRLNMDKKTELGVKAAKYVNAGQLVPDDLIISCVVDKLNTETASRVLLDGFPRTLPQAEKLATVLPLEAVVNLNVPYEVIIERAKSRWIHLPSGRVYNIGFNEPKVPFKDDVTGEDLVQRPDDHPDAVKKRLEIYDGITKPVLEYYKAQGIIVEFWGKTSDAIWPNVEQFLAKSLNEAETQQKAI